MSHLQAVGVAVTDDPNPAWGWRHAPTLPGYILHEKVKNMCGLAGITCSWVTLSNVKAWYPYIRLWLYDLRSRILLNLLHNYGMSKATMEIPGHSREMVERVYEELVRARVVRRYERICSASEYTGTKYGAVELPFLLRETAAALYDKDSADSADSVSNGHWYPSWEVKKLAMKKREESLLSSFFLDLGAGYNEDDSCNFETDAGYRRMRRLGEHVFSDVDPYKSARLRFEVMKSNVYYQLGPHGA